MLSSIYHWNLATITQFLVLDDGSVTISEIRTETIADEYNDAAAAQPTLACHDDDGPTETGNANPYTFTRKGPIIKKRKLMSNEKQDAQVHIRKK